MILRAAPGGIVLLLALAGSVGGQDDDSLASTFLSGKNYFWKNYYNWLLEKEIEGRKVHSLLYYIRYYITWKHGKKEENFKFIRKRMNFTLLIYPISFIKVSYYKSIENAIQFM